jgi:hypothetical protein
VLWAGSPIDVHLLPDFPAKWGLPSGFYVRSRRTMM